MYKIMHLTINANVKDAEKKLKEAKKALDNGNYEYAQDCADEASKLARFSIVWHVELSELKALPTKNGEYKVTITGSVSNITNGGYYHFTIDDGSDTILVEYLYTLGGGFISTVQDGDIVTVIGEFKASEVKIYAEYVHPPRFLGFFCAKI
ncbi:MAG: OB-fold nucleic acid binding domain-containing protein [Halobacteriota archaeon]|nr:OB-fold nucleic acid binding domain-containing protein [Halobacteriota archaeon]